jgi:hypothetical protein
MQFSYEASHYICYITTHCIISPCISLYNLHMRVTAVCMEWYLLCEISPIFEERRYARFDFDSN